MYALSLYRLQIQNLRKRIGFSVLSIVALAQVQSGAAPADQFKQFIETPPPVQDLFYEIRDPDHHPEFYHVRWQTNASFIGCNDGTNGVLLSTATNLTDFGNIYAKLGNIYWNKVGHDLYVWTNTSTGRITNVVTFDQETFEQIVLRTSLNFGFGMMPPGSVRWRGDEFFCTNNIFDYWYHGSLERDNDGRAASMRLAFGKPGNPQPDKKVFTYEYHYDQPLSLEYLPSRTEILLSDENGTHLYAKTTIIHSLAVADGPMPDAAFSLEPLLSTTNIAVAVTLSNGSVVYAPRDGGRPSVIKDSLAANLQRPRMQRIYFLIAILLFSIPFLIFLLSPKKEQK